MARAAAIVFLGVLALPLATPAPVSAALTANRCTAKKLKAALKRSAGLLKCYAKVAGDGVEVRPELDCVAMVEQRFTNTFADLEGDPACFDTGKTSNDVRATINDCTANILCETKAGCCPGSEAQLTGQAGGRLKVGNLDEFDFPQGTVVVVDIGNTDPADNECKHEVTVRDFSVPTFCIQGLGLSSDVMVTGCAAGSTAVGEGHVWDGYACCPDTEVVKVGDTTGECDPAADMCDAAHAGMNTCGAITTMRGDGMCEKERGVHALVDIPVKSITWMSPSGCPDPDGSFTPGTDTKIAEFDFMITLTTGMATAKFGDLDADPNNCTCAPGPAGGPPFLGGPCGEDVVRSGKPVPVTPPTTTTTTTTSTIPGGTTSTTSSTIVAPPANPQQFGPCFKIGDDLTMAAVGPVFTGAGPFNDTLFAVTVPLRVTDVRAPQPQTCTLPAAPTCCPP